MQDEPIHNEPPKEIVLAQKIADAAVDWICEQKYQGEELMHAVICCDFVSNIRFKQSLAKVILPLVSPSESPL